MNLISALCSGIAGAANGWAEIYIRGTSTRATIYSDFEASTSNSSGDNIPLDAYGSAKVYVNQLVDVVAKAPDGTVVRIWTDGYSSPNMEVISPAFTGADYVSGTTAVNEPTTLQSVLDRWLTSSGAPDWNVLLSGVPTSMEDAFGALDGLVYNVKSPQFGAIGNGTANDQAAIQAAMSAASAAGGGVVFFPPGTYRVVTALELDDTVQLLGSGPTLSALTIDSSTEHLLEFVSGTSTDGLLTVSGLAFQASQSNTAELVYLDDTCNVEFRDCLFGANANAQGILLDYEKPGCLITVERCTFYLRSTNEAIKGPGATISSATTLQVRNSTFVTPAVFTAAVVIVASDCQALSVSGCVFDGEANSTSGGANFITTGTRSTITGNIFKGTFQSAIFYIGGTVAVASGNVFIGVTTRYAVSAMLSLGSDLELDLMQEVASSTTPTVPDGLGSVQFRSSTTVPTWTMPTKLFPGQTLRLFVTNLSGAGWATMTFAGASGVTTAVNPQVGNAQQAYVEFVVMDLTGGGYGWRRVLGVGTP